MKSLSWFLGFVPFAVVALCASRAALARDEAEIRARLAAYAPVKLQADLSALSPGDRQALTKILGAVDLIDSLYWKQMGPQSLEARRALEKATDPVDRLYRDFVAINYGPFDIRRDNERFFDTPTGGERLPGLAFYPADMTKAEFEARLAAHPAIKEEYERLDTVIRRVDGTLVAIPYARLYLDDLEPAAAALREAAALVSSPTLRRYLSLRAEGLLKGDYYASDRAWLDVRDNAIDVVIGPIETYGDRLMGLKASYEAAALVKDVRGSKALEIYLKHLDGMQAALPVDEAYRKPGAGTANVLEIVNVVRFGGDFNAGIKTVAASLPNDERVIQEKGAKKQIYRNVLEAKFDAILRPIADRLLTAKDRPLVTREAFVTNVLLHELSHTLGVDYVAGKGELTVRRALGERYAAIEEAKADVVGLYDLRYLRDLEVFSEDEMPEYDATYLAGLVRSVRFGTADAHGQANAIQLSWFLRDGGVVLDARKGELTIAPKKFEPALRGLAKELLEIEGTGDYDRAGRLLDTLGKLDEPVRHLLGAIEAVPVDVVFTWPL
ncbi:MAG TPA: hypothetical protein VMQ62_05205 [Dongiaceae bacterium]|nr:hypothetical protein [Dongiaceae bacterium]